MKLARARSPRQGGVALIVAMLVIAILVAITLQFTYTTTIDLKLTRNQMRELKSYYAARGVVTLAMAHLRDDLASHGGDFGADSLHDVWVGEGGREEREAPSQTSPPGVFSASVGEVTVEYRIVDEDRKVCVNNLLVDGVREPAEGSGGEKGPETPDRSKDGEDRRRALPSDLDPDVLAEERRETTRNFIREILIQIRPGMGDAEGIVAGIEDGGPYESILELQRVEGITPALLLGERDESGRRPGLVDFLTVYSTGKVNVNTAPPEVLTAVLSERYGAEASSLAEAIRRFREPPEEGPSAGEQEGGAAAGIAGGVFESLDDLAAKVPGLEGIFGLEGEEFADDRKEGERLRRQLTVRSRFFSVTVLPSDEKPRREYRFVLRRGFLPQEPIPVLMWEERESPRRDDLPDR